MSDKLDRSKQIKLKVNSSSSVSESSNDSLKGRDTIYIDTDDDVTSIIGKIKASENSVIALVPPKRTGALQSVVNLKLLQRACKNNHKKIALITADQSLLSMAAMLSIPAARSLSEQPKLLEKPDAEDTGEDSSIDGNDIAIGELSKLDAKSYDSRRPDSRDISAAVKAIETDDEIQNDLDADGEPDHKPEPRNKDKSSKVPNFNAFRKKLLIVSGAVVAVVAFFVWAIWFAPSGTITISAKTISESYKVSVSLQPSSSTSIDKEIIQPVVKQIKKTETANFTPTGSKEVGDKATGSVVIYNNYVINSFTLPAGTIIATDGMQYTLSSSVTVPGMSGTTLDNLKPSASSAVSAVASNIGPDYNVDSGTTFSISGQSSKVYAVAKSDFTGGTKETVKVVEQSDLDSAVSKIKDNLDSTSAEEDLTSQMGNSITVIKDSFSTSYGDASSKPGVGEVVSADSATATVIITYTLVGVTSSDVEALADSQAAALLESDSTQKVYDNGADKVKFSSFSAVDSNYNVTISSSAQIGPSIDVADIKKRSLNKQAGEIISDVESISGVSNVDVKFSPFWVRTISDESKLKVEFAINE